jgi:hypothetical protein
VERILADHKPRVDDSVRQELRRFVGEDAARD